jgi:glycosyltransferase involved in cell wall biosynthesis
MTPVMENEERSSSVRLSILMSTYRRDNPSHLAEALQSLLEQTRPADEIVIVEDGPISDALSCVLEDYRRKLPLVRIRLGRNSGLAAAMSLGLPRCTGDVVARMDADDISLPERFEKQLAFLEKHPEVDVVGGAIAEFLKDSSKIRSIRRPPLDGLDLAAYAKFRNPLNHMTVMFRKLKLLQVGGYGAAKVLKLGCYQATPYEDYELWVRMIMAGCILCNLQDVLVLARCGNGMFERRGGLRYARHEISFFNQIRRSGFLSSTEFITNIALHTPVRLLPSFIRALIYRGLLRQRSYHTGEL